MTSIAVGMAVAAAASTVMQGYATKQEAKFQAKQQDANAQILRQNAYRKRLGTSLNEDTMRRQNREILAKNTAAAIEQGGGNSQTTVGALGQQATTLEQNALNLRYEGLSAAENYDIAANYANQQAKATRRMGKNAFTMSLLQAPFSAMSAYYGAGGMAGLNKSNPNNVLDSDGYLRRNNRFLSIDGNRYETWSLK